MVDPAAFMDDPNWASFLPDLQQGGPRCRLPAHEDCSPLDVEAVAGHLAPGGTLGAMPGYEARPGQLEMSRAVASAFNGRRHLMVEAGTGVGKSLAYLVPAVQWSFLNDTPVVISTATRNLQSQLISSDLPRAARTLGADAAKFRMALLKGRSNYLCLRMLGEYMQGGYWTLAEDERAAFARFLDWLFRTADGDLDDFGDDELRPRLSCPPEDCLGRACPFRSKCFVAKARARALQAHVVVANHALVLAEATNPAGGILPAFGRLVFDEAHNLEDVATGFFSYELSRPALAQLLGKLARPSKSRRGPGRTRGALGSVERQLQKGSIPSRALAEEVRELAVRAHVQIKFAQQEGDALFALLDRLFSPAPGLELVRVRRPLLPAGVPGRRQYSLRGLFADYRDDQWDEAALDAAGLRLEESLARLQGILVDLGKALRLAAEDAPGLFDDLAGQMEGVAAAFTAFILEARFVLAASDPSRVYWAEKCPANRRTRQPAHVRMVAAPLSVAGEMKRYFYDAKDSVVLCSATLRAGDKFDYMARKLGTSLVDEDRLARLVAASPFDYFRQTLMLAPNCLPDPAESMTRYVDALAPFLRDLFAASRGRGLVLFTAYEMMRAAAERTRPLLEAAGIDLLVQGDGVSRESMVAALKDALRPAVRPLVLFGAQSFWEGVDVPGPALSCVVLARLPFPQVGEPIVEARCERIKEQGGTPFRDYMLPEAQVRFRQGFGRLVRTQGDRGVVVVTDPRLAAKNYGALFRKAVPASVHTMATLEETLARAAEFLAR
ncbi:MAG: helicase C-terminal domain-containing protein [Kiritimatiellae bacterium]|nr:helicase C-terminal domain-containing protein [Kiritimatiellia bacterium]